MDGRAELAWVAGNIKDGLLIQRWLPIPVLSREWIIFVTYPLLSALMSLVEQ